jgi:general secretion pathway protein G
MQDALTACAGRQSSMASIWRTEGHYFQSGFELLELIIVLAIIAVLGFIAIPSYVNYRNQADIATAEADINTIEQAIGKYYQENNSYPDILGEVKMGGLLDPWRHPYQYLRIAGAKLKGNGALRKDKNQMQINTDYDLYSMGKDGASVSPLTANISRDDVVRAYNGKYIGLAADLL